MCYSLTHLVNLALQLYQSRGASSELIDLVVTEITSLQEIEQGPKGHVLNAFSHPKLLVLTQDKKPKWCHWGLIPSWTKSKNDALQIWNKTINARGESIFEKPSFREAAKSKRCIIYADSFFEHFHQNGKSYPYRIFRKNGGPMVLAGLWQEWVDRTTGEVWNTCTVVTTVANPLLSRIHNNPKLKESRMPVILDQENEATWLNKEITKEQMYALLVPYTDSELDAYTVRRILGKTALGDVPEALEKFNYEELIADQGSLF